MAEILQDLNDEGRVDAKTSDATGDPSTHRAIGLSLASVLDLSRELSGVLVAIQPRPEFREELYGHLMVEARRQRALRTLSLPVGSDSALEKPATIVRRLSPSYGRGNRRWFIGAAAVGSAASLVGLLAYVRNRHHGSVA
jgi:hypothetical protein